MLLASLAASPRLLRTAGDQREGLADDDGDGALFTVPALAPGQRESRCIRVTHRGDASDVALKADVTGALAADLDLTVARGGGGGFGSCEGFDGRIFYRGTLADAERDLDDAPAWRADGADASTYRFILSAGKDLAATPARTRVSFHWSQATPADPAAAPPADAPQPGAGAGGTAAGGAATPSAVLPATVAAVPGAETLAEAEAEADGAGRDARRRRQRREAEARERRRGGHLGASPDRTSPADGADHRSPRPSSLADALRRIGKTIAHAATEGAKRAAFPMLLLLAMSLFLLTQNRFDARDPKLALAPLQGSRDLAFDDPDADARYR